MVQVDCAGERVFVGEDRQPNDLETMPFQPQQRVKGRAVFGQGGNDASSSLFGMQSDPEQS